MLLGKTFAYNVIKSFSLVYTNLKLIVKQVHTTYINRSPNA